MVIRSSTNPTTPMPPASDFIDKDLTRPTGRRPSYRTVKQVKETIACLNQMELNQVARNEYEVLGLAADGEDGELGEMLFYGERDKVVAWANLWLQ